jgi:hypothetical protein
VGKEWVEGKGGGTGKGVEITQTFYVHMNKQKKIHQLMLVTCGRKGTLIHCWWEGKLIQPLWKSIWSFLKKLKQTCYVPTIPLLCISPKECKSIYKRDTCTPMFLAAMVHSS